MGVRSEWMGIDQLGQRGERVCGAVCLHLHNVHPLQRFLPQIQAHYWHCVRPDRRFPPLGSLYAAQYIPAVYSGRSKVLVTQYIPPILLFNTAYL